MKKIESEQPYEDKIDLTQIALNTPKDKMAQLTIIPTGATLAFAGSKTLQQFGKRGFRRNGETKMEYLMDRIFEYSRSKDGMMLSSLLKLAQTQIEVTPVESDGMGKSKLFNMD